MSGKKKTRGKSQGTKGNLSIEKLIQSLSIGNSEKNQRGFFPLGVYTGFVADYRKRRVLYLEDAAEQIIGVPMKKILETPLDELFSQLITPDHLHISGQTELIALQHLSVDPKENVVVNLEYNIRFGGKKIKRLLLQIMAGSLDSNGFPTLLYGYVTDISHIIPDGPPRITVMNGSRVETIIHSWPEGISAETRFKLTHRELSVLVHKRQGLRTKEIAQHLKLREMTVYSIIRDIKKKTGMDIIPLINLLVQNGTIAR